MAEFLVTAPAGGPFAHHAQRTGNTRCLQPLYSVTILECCKRLFKKTWFGDVGYFLGLSCVEDGKIDRQHHDQYSDGSQKKDAHFLQLGLRLLLAAERNHTPSTEGNAYDGRE